MIEAEIMDGAGEAVRVGENDGNTLLGPDPFLQPSILKAFFEVLPLAQLAKCRLVSKLWYEESLSTWRSTAAIRFWKEGIVSTAEDGSDSEHTTSLGEFLNLWEAEGWGSCPFKQFGFICWKFQAKDMERQRFLELVGSHITSLTLFKCKFGGAGNFQKMLFQALPSLQFLEMKHCNVGKGYGSPEEILVYKEPTFGVHGLKSLKISPFPPSSMLMDMLSHFHKVRSLKLEPPDHAEHWDLLETIRVIRAQDGTKLPLKNFDVHCYLVLGKDTQRTASYIEVLRFQDQLNLPLQRLVVLFDQDYSFYENEDSDLKDILQYHSSTLKCLQFMLYPPRFRLCHSFSFGVHLEALKELDLPSHFFDSLNYLRATPNLRLLRLITYLDISMAESDELFSNSGQLEIGDWTLPSLRKLLLGSGCKLPFPLSVCSLGKLVKWMPNVEQFEGVQLDDVKLAMICSNWKHLKILEDVGEELTDEGVIGIVRGIGHEADGDDVPNITKIKNLISFGTNSSRLTSASVVEGFLKLSNLKELSMGNFEELDDEAKAALERRNIGPCVVRD